MLGLFDIANVTPNVAETSWDRHLENFVASPAFHGAYPPRFRQRNEQAVLPMEGVAIWAWSLLVWLDLPPIALIGLYLLDRRTAPLKLLNKGC